MRLALACLCFCLYFCLSAARPAVAGAWPFPQGAGQLILTTLLANARNAYDPAGRLIATPPYRKFEARAYLEHGLTDWLTFVGEGSVMSFRGAPAPYDPIELLIAEAKAGQPFYLPPVVGSKYEGLGLGAAGARLRLLNVGDYVLSIQGSLRGASRDARRFLDMGGAVQLDARLMMGRTFSLFGLAGFLDTQIGYRGRGQNGDEIRVDLTAGIRPFERTLLMAQSFSALAPRGGAAGHVAEQKFQLSGVYDLTTTVSLQIGGVAALGGVNAPAERGVICAVWWRY